ncbi:MAG: hypothetical protein EBQ97_07855, partial [Bacteroidetes bacterium]|nr:hypothetical protein [Bacteroidota bacterium]
MLKLPQDFIDSVNRALPGKEVEDLILAIQESPKVSIRLNPTKGISASSFCNDILGDSIAHCTDGFLLNTRPLFTADP